MQLYQTYIAKNSALSEFTIFLNCCISGALSKPEKIYLQNSNLQYTLGFENVNKGNIRECFFLNQLLVKHKVHIAKDGGDFMVDEKYTFEVGGAYNGFKQIANKKHSYIVADDLVTGMQNKIPMWLFGFIS